MSIQSVENKIQGKTYVEAGRMIFDAWKSGELSLPEYQQMANWYEVWQGGSQIVTGKHFTTTTTQRAVATEATTEYKEQRVQLIGNVVPTSEVRPLISGGVADKLREAGFSESNLDVLQKGGWNQENVNDLIAEANSLGITAPSQVDPRTLVVTPAESTQNYYYQSNISPLLLLGLGLGLLLLCGKK